MNNNKILIFITLMCLIIPNVLGESEWVFVQSCATGQERSLTFETTDYSTNAVIADFNSGYEDSNYLVCGDNAIAEGIIEISGRGGGTYPVWPYLQDEPCDYSADRDRGCVAELPSTGLMYYENLECRRFKVDIRGASFSLYDTDDGWVYLERDDDYYPSSHYASSNNYNFNIGTNEDGIISNTETSIDGGYDSAGMVYDMYCETCSDEQWFRYYIEEKSSYSYSAWYSWLSGWITEVVQNSAHDEGTCCNSVDQIFSSPEDNKCCYEGEVYQNDEIINSEFVCLDGEISEISNVCDQDGDGQWDDSIWYCVGGTDCDDTNIYVYLGAEEICWDLIDNNCPGDAGYGLVDEDCGTRCEIKTECDVGENEILHFSNSNGGQVELITEGWYTNKLCCPGLSLSDDGVDAIRVSGPKNAHVELFTEENYPRIVKVNSEACRYDTRCTDEELCVLALPPGQVTNMHATTCGLGDFNQLCCGANLEEDICIETEGQEEVEHSCQDCIDNDCDGLLDGADPDCQGTEPGFCYKTENVESNCGDSLDNDCDGYTDNGDTDCNAELGEGVCEPLICDNSDPLNLIYIWGTCTTSEGTGIYGPNCNCIVNDCDEEGTDCEYTLLNGETCDGICDENLDCIDIFYDGCPYCPPNSEGTLCRQGNGCFGRYDTFCNCVDIPGDGCPDKKNKYLCGNGNIDSGEQCDRYNFGSIKSCIDAGYLSGALRCDAFCDIAGCSMVPCVPASEDNCPANCLNTNDGGNTCYSDSQCLELCGSGIELNVTAENIITQKKVVIYDGKPIVVNVVVWNN